MDQDVVPSHAGIRPRNEVPFISQVNHTAAARSQKKVDAAMAQCQSVDRR